jgi:hypothetical protein
MNASFSSESLRSAPATQAPPTVSHSPSVPISIYRELATELQATQTLVDTLTNQNQQLSQQNQLLRQEMLKFAESAAQLKQAVEISQPTPATPTAALAQPVALTSDEADPELVAPDLATVSLSDRLTESMGEGVSRLAGQLNQIVAPKPSKKAAKKAPGRPPARLPQARPEPLYSEERLAPARPTQMTGRSADFSGLWLATTILLIVVSAFGAGFLIMKPLLNGSK